MATSTITGLAAVLAADLDDTTVLPVDDNDGHTRKATIAQLRTQLNSADQLFPDGLYDIGKSGATRPRDGFFSRNMTIGGTAYIGDTANADVTQGLTINQGAADDQILALKSADVAHGITTAAETDSFATFAKSGPLVGGLTVRGFSEDILGMSVEGWITADDTGKTTTANAAVRLLATKKNGASIQDMGSNANLVAIVNNSTTRYLFDAEGSAHGDVEWTTF